MTATGTELQSLHGKVALVTGGGTGIGRMTAIQLARSGARVVIYSRRLEVLKACATEIEAMGCEKVLCIAGDTREPDQVEGALVRVKEVHGRLDILVNNAGGQFAAAAKDISNKGFAAVITNNLVASWHVTSAAARQFMLENGGKVIFVTAAHRSGFRGFSHTASARGGVAALVKSLAAEWAEYGIQLNAVAPGTIEVDAMTQYPIPRERWDAQKEVGRFLFDNALDIGLYGFDVIWPLGTKVASWKEHIRLGDTRNINGMEYARPR